MARLPTRGVYDASKPLVCRKALKHGGKLYQPGDSFPGKMTAPITERRLRQLFDMGSLVQDGQADAPAPEPEVVTEVEEEVETESEAEEETEEEELE